MKNIKYSQLHYLWDPLMTVKKNIRIENFGKELDRRVKVDEFII